MKVRLILKGASSSLTVKRRPLGDPAGKNRKVGKHPLKFNMEPENGPPGKDILFFLKVSFSGFMLNFGGVSLGFEGMM